MSVADAASVETRRVPPLRLQGKVAVVTGTNGGLGSAIAEAFALEGASVVCSYHSDTCTSTPLPAANAATEAANLDPQRIEADKTAAAVRAAGKCSVLALQSHWQQQCM